MAYIQPGVTVIQEFIGAVPALAVFSLPNVQVGPTFQVKKEADAGEYDGTSDTYSYPDQLAGTIIDDRELDETDLTSYPVRIFLSETIVRLLTGTVGAVLIADLNQFTDATSDVFANIAAGDVIVVTGSGIAEVREFSTVPDVAGSLNNTYLDNLYDGLGNGYYIWFNINGAGVDPALVGKTGIMVAGVTNVTANALATTIRANVAAVGGGLVFSTGGSAALVTITNLNKGAAVDLVDGAVPTGFTGITTTTQGQNALNDGSYTVRSKVNNNTLQTNETFAVAQTGLNYSIRRNIGLEEDFELIEVTDETGVVITRDDFQLPSGLSITYSPFGSIPVISATVLVNYRALRFDQSADVFEYGTLAELQAAFGTDQIVPENTAAFGVFIALLNSPTKTNLLALPVDYLDTGSGEGDELIAYLKAFDVLRLTEMYAISVLTSNTSVHTALKAHVEGLSDPLKKLERVGIINRLLVTTSTIIDDLTDGTVDGTGLIFGSASALFLTSGVVPGHFINVTAPSGAVGRYKIAAVNSQTEVELTTAVPGGPLTSVEFFVDKDLQKSEQASVIAAYASALASRRIVLTWPDQIRFPSGNEVRLLPGYFLNPCIGALTTGLPTQQGLTNLSVAGYVGVRHSTKYFDNDQLNLIADGGVMIFVQDVLDQTPLFVRHQLTTDRSAIKFQEYSVTKNVDFISKFIRTNHQSFIGQYNIVDSTFDDLKTAAAGNIKFLAEQTKRPRIGGVIRSGKLVSIEQDTVNIDTILERWELSIPIPLNNLVITIVV